MDKRLITVVAASTALSLPAPDMDTDRKPVAKRLDTAEALHIESERLVDPIPVMVEREARPFEPMIHNDTWLPFWDDDGADGVDADATPLGSPLVLMVSAEQSDYS